MARSPDGPPPPPTVQRLRLHYAKRGRLRFSSHRDFQRAFERALRRAGVPIAFSAGFSPHPKVSYAGAAATGAASEAEYLEIGLARICEPDDVRRRLDQALPAGLDVVEVLDVTGVPGALADLLVASVWRIELPGVPPDAARAAVGAFLAQERVDVERLTKSGVRRFDARAAVLVLESGAAAAPGAELSCAILRAVVRHTTPAVRPDDVLTALRAVADLAPPLPPRVTRLAQGPLDEGDRTVADPLAADRARAARGTSSAREG